MGAPITLTRPCQVPSKPPKAPRRKKPSSNSATSRAIHRLTHGRLQLKGFIEAILFNGPKVQDAFPTSLLPHWI